MSKYPNLRYNKNILKGVEIHNPTILDSALKGVVAEYKQKSKEVIMFEYGSTLAPQSYLLNRMFRPKAHFMNVTHGPAVRAISRHLIIPELTTKFPWTQDHLMNYQAFDYKNSEWFKNLRNSVLFCGSKDAEIYRNTTCFRGWVFRYFLDQTKLIEHRVKELGITDKTKVDKVTADFDKKIDDEYLAENPAKVDETIEPYKCSVDENTQFLEFLDFSFYETPSNQNANLASIFKHKVKAKTFPSFNLTSMALDIAAINHYSLARDLNNPEVYNTVPLDLAHNVEKIVFLHADSAMRILQRPTPEHTSNKFKQFHFRSKYTFRMQTMFDVEPLAFLSPTDCEKFLLQKRSHVKKDEFNQKEVDDGNFVGLHSYKSIRDYIKEHYPQTRIIENIDSTSIKFKNYKMDGPLVILRLKPSEYLLKNASNIRIDILRTAMMKILSKPRSTLVTNLAFIAQAEARKEILENIDLEYFSTTAMMDVTKDRFFEFYEVLEKVLIKWNLLNENHLELDIDENTVMG